MKRYRKLDNHMMFLWIVLPILVFFISMNATYAFFTASITKAESLSSTSIIKVGFTTETVGKVNAVSISDTTKLIPGDVLSIDGAVENVGKSQFYAILKLVVNVTKEGETDPEEVTKKLYAFNNSIATEILETDSGYNVTAFTVEAPNENRTNTFTKNFTLSYKFDFYKYDNTYKNATVNYEVTAYAIQYVNIDSPTVATQILINTATAN